MAPKGRSHRSAAGLGRHGSSARAEATFRAWDTDRSGKLSRKEFFSVRGLRGAASGTGIGESGTDLGGVHLRRTLKRGSILESIAT